MTCGNAGASSGCRVLTPCATAWTCKCNYLCNGDALTAMSALRYPLSTVLRGRDDLEFAGRDIGIDGLARHDDGVGFCFRRGVAAKRFAGSATKRNRIVIAMQLISASPGAVALLLAAG